MYITMINASTSIRLLRFDPLFLTSVIISYVFSNGSNALLTDTIIYPDTINKGVKIPIER
jgi:hypothetical protein